MKVAIVVDRQLPIGLIGNCAAVLGVSLGMTHPDIVGPDLQDHSGIEHRGITGLPIPILSSDRDQLRELVQTCQSEPSITVIAFNDVAQRCKSYPEYEEKLAQTAFSSLNFLGILLIGSAQAVSRLTGSLPLLR